MRCRNLLKFDGYSQSIVGRGRLARRIHLPIPLQNDSHCCPALARNRLVGTLGFVTFALKIIEIA